MGTNISSLAPEYIDARYGDTHANSTGYAPSFHHCHNDGPDGYDAENSNPNVRPSDYHHGFKPALASSAAATTQTSNISTSQAHQRHSQPHVEQHQQQQHQQKARIARVGRNVRAKDHVKQWMQTTDPNSTRPPGMHYTTMSRLHAHEYSPLRKIPSEGNRFISDDDL